MATGGDTKKKGGKGAPKLKRAGTLHSKHKYSSQFLRTYKNKLRRVRKCNGEAAAQKYARENPMVGKTVSAHVVLPTAKALKHSVKR